jgi:hypothetical protein
MALSGESVPSEPIRSETTEARAASSAALQHGNPIRFERCIPEARLSRTKTVQDFDLAQYLKVSAGHAAANPSGTIGIVPAWYQQWLKSAIKMMMGIGTPSRKSKIERIVKPPQLVL